MDTVTALDENEKEVSFVGELVEESEDEHQVEARHPINTESVKLYKRNDGQFVFTMKFQFEEMDPHHYEVHVGDSPQATGFHTPSHRSYIRPARYTLNIR